MAEAKQVSTSTLEVRVTRKGLELTDDDLARLKELGFNIVSTKVFPDGGAAADTICRSSC